MGSGKGDAPPPIDPGKAMGEYLFGGDFTSFGGVTDPRLQERLIGAEEQFRPRYAALELADIATFARGIEGGVDSLAYQNKSAELEALKAARAERGDEDFDSDATVDAIMGPRPSNENYQQFGIPRLDGGGRKKLKAEQEAYDSRKQVLQGSITGINSLDAEIVKVENQLRTIEAGGTPGLFDLLEESGRRAGEIQRESLRLQRAEDVAALQEYAPQVVEAYREADPFSTEMAELQSAQARRLYEEAEGPLSPERRRLAEQQARAGSLARGRLGDESGIAAEILGREQFKAGLRGEARQAGQLAFGQSRALAGDLGATILGRPSQALALGQNVLGQAQGQAAGPMGPQLFDPNVGINLALQQRGQNIEFQGMQAQARGAMIGGLAQGLGTYAGLQ
jgi:hypothetical protein